MIALPGNEIASVSSILIEYISPDFEGAATSSATDSGECKDSSSSSSMHDDLKTDEYDVKNDVVDSSVCGGCDDPVVVFHDPDKKIEGNESEREISPQVPSREGHSGLVVSNDGGSHHVLSPSSGGLAPSVNVNPPTILTSGIFVNPYAPSFAPTTTTMAGGAPSFAPTTTTMAGGAPSFAYMNMGYPNLMLLHHHQQQQQFHQMQQQEQQLRMATGSGFGQTFAEMPHGMYSHGLAGMFAPPSPYARGYSMGMPVFDPLSLYNVPGPIPAMWSPHVAPAATSKEIDIDSAELAATTLLSLAPRRSGRRIPGITVTADSENDEEIEEEEDGQDGRYDCKIGSLSYTTTSRSNSLAQHMRKPFICEAPGCDYATNHRGNLKSHHLKHLDSKPFKCDFPDCTYSAKWRNVLKQHSAVHSGIKPFACNMEGCPYIAARLGNLKSHQHRFHGLSLKK